MVTRHYTPLTRDLLLELALYSGHRAGSYLQLRIRPGLCFCLIFQFSQLRMRFDSTQHRIDCYLKLQAQVSIVCFLQIRGKAPTVCPRGVCLEQSSDTLVRNWRAHDNYYEVR